MLGFLCGSPNIAFGTHIYGPEVYWFRPETSFACLPQAWQLSHVLPLFKAHSHWVPHSEIMGCKTRSDVCWTKWWVLNKVLISLPEPSRVRDLIAQPYTLRFVFFASTLCVTDILPLPHISPVSFVCKMWAYSISQYIIWRKINPV